MARAEPAGLEGCPHRLSNPSDSSRQADKWVLRIAARPKDDSEYSFLYCSVAMYFTYILASRPYGTLYTGVTGKLVARVSQHRTGHFSGFTSKYGVHRLVWYEPHDNISVAIHREKRIKHWRRAWKINLIEADNPHWQDLYLEFFRAPPGPLTGIVPPNF